MEALGAQNGPSASCVWPAMYIVHVLKRPGPCGMLAVAMYPAYTLSSECAAYNARTWNAYYACDSGYMSMLVFSSDYSSCNDNT